MVDANARDGSNNVASIAIVQADIPRRVAAAAVAVVLAVMSVCCWRFASLARGALISRIAGVSHDRAVMAAGAEGLGAARPAGIVLMKENAGRAS